MLASYVITRWISVRYVAIWQLFLCMQWLTQGVNGVSSHPTWVSYLHNIASNLLPDLILEVQIFKTFLEACPPDPMHTRTCWARCWVWFAHTMQASTTLSNPHFKFWHYINISNMYMKDLTKLKPKPATHLDLFLDQYLAWQVASHISPL